MQRSVLSLALVSALLPSPGAIAAPDAAQGKPADASTAPVPSEPGQTSATFGDWVLRCERVGQGEAAHRLCEVAQSLVIQGQQAPIAQLAFGRPPKSQDTKTEDKSSDEALVLTVLVPTNITFAKPPVLASAKEGGATLGLAFRRCLPGGCLADGVPDAAFLKALRPTKPGLLTFTDAAERTITLPVSFRGLSQALEDFAKEDFAKERKTDPAKAVTR